MIHFPMNALFNALPAFVLSALFIELAILIVKPSYRLRSLARFIPLIRLPIDLFRYDFTRWAHVAHIDPHLQPEESRTLSLKLGWGKIEGTLSTASGHTFTPVDWFAADWPMWICVAIVGPVLLISLCRLIKQLVVEWQTYQKIRRGDIEMAGATFVGGKTILLPPTLLAQLTAEEVAAVIAHEKEHLKWYDPVFALLERMLGAFYWFIPGINWWLKRIDLDRERACDLAATKAGVLPTVVAAAIQKCYFFNQAQAVPSSFTGSTTYRRVHDLLHFTQKRHAAIRLILVTYITLATLLGSFWLP